MVIFLKNPHTTNDLVDLVFFPMTLIQTLLLSSPYLRPFTPLAGRAGWLVLLVGSIAAAVRWERF